MIKTYLKTSADTEGRRMDVYNGIRTELGMHYINSTVVLVAGWIAVNQEPLSPPFMCRCVLDHSMGVCPSQQTAKHGTGPGMARFSVAGFSDELLWHVVTLFGGNPNCVFFCLEALGFGHPTSVTVSMFSCRMRASQRCWNDSGDNIRCVFEGRVGAQSSESSASAFRIRSYDFGEDVHSLSVWESAHAKHAC